MKKLIIYVLSLFGVIGLSAQTVELNSFDKVDVSGGISVDLIYSNKVEAKVNMIEGNYEDLIIETKPNGRLSISFKKQKGWSSWGGSREAEIDLYYNNSIDEISVSAGATVESSELFSAKYMKFDASSGGIICLDVDVEKVKSDANSGAIITLEGNAVRQDVDVSSGAIYKAVDLKSDDADVDASSGSIAKVWVENRLTADAGSGAIIKFTGEPRHKDLDSGKWSGAIICEF